MPLIKKLCKKCISNVYGKWVKGDELWWKEDRKVICPDEYTEEDGENNYRNITDGPPNKCPFLIEHILTNQGKK